MVGKCSNVSDLVWALDDSKALDHGFFACQRLASIAHSCNVKVGSAMWLNLNTKVCHGVNFHLGVLPAHNDRFALTNWIQDHLGTLADWNGTELVEET